MGHRERFLGFVADEFTYLYPFALSMLGHHSALRCSNGVIIASAAGFQQGCPTSPMFVSLLLELFLREHERELENLELLGFYLDDGSIGGSPADVDKVFNLLVRDGAKYGLIVNTEKCELIIDESEVEKVKCASDVSIITNGNIDIVGVPFGSNQFIEEYFAKQLDDVDEFCRRLRLLNNPQIAFLLLSNHASLCKVNFMMRTVPPSQLFNSLARYDKIIRQTVECIAGHPLNDTQYRQVNLSFRNGGLGMRNATNISCAAYLASEALVSKSQVDLLSGEAKEFYDISSEHVKMENIQLYNKQVIPAKCIDEDTPTHQLTQFKLMEEIEQKTTLDIMQSSSERGKAHFIGSSVKKSYGFLRATPNPWEGGSFDPVQFRIAMKVHVKLWVHLIREEERCLECGSVLDPFGDHGLVCSSGTGRIYRHDKIAVAISRLLHESNHDHTLELTHLTGDNKERPSDIFIPNWNGKDVGVDVGVVCPTARSYRKGASCNRLYAADQMHKRKEEKYGTICKENGFDYVPLVCETTGGWCQKSKEFFDSLSEKIASSKNEDIRKVKNRVYKRLSVALQRANVTAILNHYKLAR